MQYFKVILCLYVICVWTCCGVPRGKNCHKSESRGQSMSSGSCPDFCQEPTETGPCKASKPMFGYKPASKSCQEFTYGGCQGNDNNFNTEAECNTACGGCNSGGGGGVGGGGDGGGVSGGGGGVGGSCPEQCKLPTEKGPCRADVPKFGYAADSKSCKEFAYGGCQGNDNNFNTQEECKTTCGSCT